jgi:hypothetical protein
MLTADRLLLFRFWAQCNVNLDRLLLPGYSAQCNVNRWSSLTASLYGAV